jgi:glucarate dehydratase
MSQAGRISDLTATTVTVPLEAPLRHSNGAHWGRFVRTIVEVFTDTGLVGLGEMGGGGQSAELAFQGLKPYLLGHDPFELEALRWKIAMRTTVIQVGQAGSPSSPVRTTLRLACVRAIRLT